MKKAIINNKNKSSEKEEIKLVTTTKEANLTTNDFKQVF